MCLDDVVGNGEMYRSYNLDPKFPFAVEVHRHFSNIFPEVQMSEMKTLHDDNNVNDDRVRDSIRRRKRSRQEPEQRDVCYNHGDRMDRVLNHSFAPRDTNDYFLSDDKQFYTPAKIKKRLSDCEPLDNLFHDCAEEKQGDGPDGVPSAFFLQPEIGSDYQLLHCFACGKSMHIMPTRAKPYHNMVRSRTVRFNF